MIGSLSLLLLFHTSLSALRWRKYLQANQEDLFLPLDIILELVIAIIFAIWTILSQAKKFKPIKEFHQTQSYDSSFHRKNFKNYNSLRAELFIPILQSKLKTEDFRLELNL